MSRSLPMLASILGLTALSALAPLGCDDGSGDDASGVGAVEFTSWGEEYIEDKIPAEQFADGYSVKYTKFLVMVGSVEVADADGAVAAKYGTYTLFNHTVAGVKPLTSFKDVPAKAYTKVSYELAPTTADKITLGPSVTDADRDLMVSGKFHLYVEGTISKAAVSKSFKWGFGVPTPLIDCKGEKDGKEVDGVVVTNGGTDTVQLTIHGDHLFYDDLQSPDAKLRGDSIVSADADMNGEVTLAELGMVSLVDLPANQYGTGAATAVNDLGAFVTFLSRTVGHYRGEGECFITESK